MPKRNAQGNGTMRRRPDGRWEARYTVGRDPGTGKQVQKSVYGDTQKEVRQKLAQITTDIDNGVYIEPSKMTLAQWLDIWVSDYMGDKKWSTVKHYKAQINTNILPALGAVKIGALVPHQIQKFYNAMLENHSPKSVKNIHGILTKSLSVAMALGYIKLNPCNMCTLPRVEKPQMHVLDDEQVTALLRYEDDSVYISLYKVLLLTGLRESEGCGLTWDCVDFDKGTLTVTKQLQRRDGAWVYASLKNDKTRIIKPAPFVMSLLQERRRRQREDRLRAGSAWLAWNSPKTEQSAPVFTNPLGDFLHMRTVAKHLKIILRKIRAPEDIHVHSLRHTFAVLSLQNGDDVKTVQENLGHATAAFTLDVYGHVSERMRDDSAQRMEKYIAGL